MEFNTAKENQHASAMATICFRMLLTFSKEYKDARGQEAADKFECAVFIRLCQRLLKQGVAGEEMRVMIMELQDALEAGDL